MTHKEVSSQLPTFRLSVAAQMAEYRQRIAEQIRREREKRGWRREDLAQKTGASYRQIERWETAKSRPQAANIKKLAEVFEVDVSVLRPDLEAEEEELRQYLVRVETNQERILAEIAAMRDAHAAAEARVLTELRSLARKLGTAAKGSRSRSSG